jgi:hypothetical protein
VVLGLEGGCDPIVEALAEVRKHVGLIPTDVEQDGEGDRVVAFAADAVGVEGWTGVDLDVELLRYKFRKGMPADGIDNRWNLNNSRGQMKGIGGTEGVVRMFPG